MNFKKVQYMTFFNSGGKNSPCFAPAESRGFQNTMFRAFSAQAVSYQMQAEIQDHAFETGRGGQYYFMRNVTVMIAHELQ